MAPAGYIEPERKAKLQALGKAVKEAAKARDRAIMEAVEVGISLRTVADAVGLSHVAVRDIAGRMRDILDGRKPSPHHYPRRSELDDW